MQLFTDSAAGKGLGFGAVFGNMWAHGVWPEMWHMSGITSDITVLEMFPILVSLVVWGPYLPNKKIRFRCDNEAVLHILNTMTSRSEKKMILVRATTLECMKHNMVIKITHIAGKTNVLCDLICRLCTSEISRIIPGSRQRASGYSRPTLEDIQLGCNVLLDASMSENTKMVYQNALKRFTNFRQSYSIPNVWPVPTAHLASFVSFCFSQTYSPATVTTYMSSISCIHKLKNMDDPTLLFIIKRCWKASGV